MAHPNSLANLRPPWKAGEPSANPLGRPKRRTVVELCREELRRIAEEAGLKVTDEDADLLAARAWAALIARGNVVALKEYLDRRDGAVKANVHVEHEISDVLRGEWQRWAKRPEEVGAEDAEFRLTGDAPAS